MSTLIAFHHMPVVALWALLAVTALRAQDDVGTLDAALKRLQAALPRSASDCKAAQRPELVEKACTDAIAAMRRAGSPAPTAPVDDVMRRVEAVAAAQVAVDRALDDVFGLRQDFIKETDPAQRRQMLNHYLRVCNLLVDLSGRLRFQAEETFNEAAYRAAPVPALRDRILDVIAKYNSVTGAEVMSWLLFDPPANSPNKAQPATAAQKQRTLQLIVQTAAVETMPLLARFVREEKRYPDLIVAAADTLRRLGFPQDPRPGDTTELARPAITAAELVPILKQQVVRDANVAKLRDELIKGAEARRDQGFSGDVYRYGGIEARPGDWLLMRNPSPYNLVTDLAPGLFTHVGVVAAEKGTDGKRRIVAVDLTTEGTRIRTTNVEAFIRQYRNCVVLRHPDPKVAQIMAATAASVIGNEAAFDLNYRIDNVVALKGQPKQGKLIKTYCAGLLLLCGQETGIDRARLFPISEVMANDKAAKNLKDVGISFGANFVSPTGPLFSPELVIAGKRLPVYDPRVEIEDSIYNYFADCLRQRDLIPDADPMQKAKLTLAEASKTNPSLGRLLAQLNNVNPSMDLVAAAKAAHTLEHLDRAALGSGRQFMDAMFALTSGPLDQLRAQGFNDQQLTLFRNLRQQHAELYSEFLAEKLDGETLQKALQTHYTQQGKAEIAKRFKPETAAPRP